MAKESFVDKMVNRLFGGEAKQLSAVLSRLKAAQDAAQAGNGPFSTPKQPVPGSMILGTAVQAASQNAAIQQQNQTNATQQAQLTRLATAAGLLTPGQALSTANVGNVIDSATKRLDALKDRMEKVGGGANSGIANFAKMTAPGASASQIVSGAAGVAGAAGMIAGGPIGAAVTVGSQFVKTLADSVQVLTTWTKGLHQANLQFAQFSPHMTQVALESRVREIRLERARGERRAESAKALAESQIHIDRIGAEVGDVWGNLMNKLGTGINKFLLWNIQTTNNFLSDLLKMPRKDIAKELAKREEGGEVLGDFLDDVTRNDRAFQQWGRPKRHAP